MASFTWHSSKKFCDAEAHKASHACPDCETASQCTGCLGQIAPGEVHAICAETGEVAHPACKAAAERAWGYLY
ncbi:MULTISPECIES: hypothetical protein [Micromonospora]|uniref:hypothetical protein n=1 Tax=Micromonospora TaxID=1873 RepID=UPI0004C29D31|nr:hypothetical protein [Micromonospora globosa]